MQILELVHNLRILFKNNYPYSASFDKLPIEIKVGLNRTSFIDDFDLIRKNQKIQIKKWIKILDKDDDYNVINEGDKHINGSTVVISNGKIKIVIKPKLADSDLFIKKMSDKLSLVLGTNISVPEIKQKNGFYVQKFIQEEKTKKKDDYNFGVLIIFCLWFGLIDLHFENIILSNNSVNLIDADCLFFSKKRKRFKGRIQNIGLFYTDTENIHKSGITKFNLNPNFSSIEKGYLDALNILKSDKFFSNYEEYDKIYFRRVYLSTELYSRFLNKRFLYGWDNLKVEQEWYRIRMAYTLEKPINNFTELIKSEIKELKKWCIPFFYQKGNQIFNQKLEFIGNPPEKPSIRFRTVHKYLINKGNVINDIKIVLEETNEMLRTTLANNVQK